MNQLEVTVRARYSERQLDPTRCYRRSRRTDAEVVARCAKRRDNQRFSVLATFNEGMISDGMFATLSYGLNFASQKEAERFAARVRRSGKINFRYWSGNPSFGYTSYEDAKANVLLGNSQ